LFQLEVEGLEGIGRFINAELDSKIDREMERLFFTQIVPYAKSIAPVRTGRYKSEISAKKVGIGRWALTAGAPYSPFVEYDTAAHDINSPVFIHDVGWRFIGRHPGTKGQHILQRALLEHGLQIVNAFKCAMDELIKTDC